MHTYTNPFHSVNYQGSKPVITTDVKPLEYFAHQIFKISANHFDVVFDGVLVGQYAGPNGAAQFVDKRVEAMAEKPRR